MKNPQPIQLLGIGQNLSPEESIARVPLRRRVGTRQMPAERQAPRKRRGHFMIVIVLCLFAFSLQSRAADSASVSRLLTAAASEAQAGRNGPAMLAAERASWLAPRDATVNRQLASVRQQAGVAGASSSFLTRATHLLSFDALTALASISLMMLCLLVFGTRLIPATFRKLARGVAGTLGVIALTAAAGVASRWPELDRAIVMIPEAGARIAPAESASLVFETKPGQLVALQKTYGNFVRVQTQDGRAGWLPISSVERILPPAGRMPAPQLPAAQLPAPQLPMPAPQLPATKLPPPPATGNPAVESL
jgi:hypothetical protein